jgi:hypothetical protein
MKLFLPFLVAGMILMALLQAQFLRPSLFEEVRDHARSPSLFSIPGVKAGAGHASMAGTSPLVLGDPLEERPDKSGANTAPRRPSFRGEPKEAVAVDQTVKGSSGVSDGGFTPDGDLRP